MMTLDAKPHIFCPVSGQVEIEQNNCELVYIGTEGMLVRSHDELDEGTVLRNIRFTISGCSEDFVAAGRVVGNLIGLTAIMFLDEPAGLLDLLNNQFSEE